MSPSASRACDHPATRREAGRFGERETTRAALACHFETIVDLDGHGFVDGGDILVTGREVLVGLSSRTDESGVGALERLLADLGIRLRRVRTPTQTLHFKTACALLDAGTVFSTVALAATGCFLGVPHRRVSHRRRARSEPDPVNDVVLLSEDIRSRPSCWNPRVSRWKPFPPPRRRSWTGGCHACRCAGEATASSL